MNSKLKYDLNSPSISRMESEVHFKRNVGTKSSDRIKRLLKKGVLAYFLFVIFEGALRKWVLPELAAPLLLLRDPLAIWLVYRSSIDGIWKPNGYVLLAWAITIFAFVLAIITGHGSIAVALYGLRIMVFHFPLIFIIGSVLNKEDVIKLGRTLLWICLGMTILVAIQFYSPQSAWVNRGVGGDLEGSGFSGAGEFYRVPGTFSFTTGLSLFYGFVAAYIFFFWIARHKVQISQGLLIASTFALLAALPLSISRTVLFEVVLSFLFMAAIAIKKPNLMKPIVALLIIGTGLLIILNNFSFFNTATEAFTERLFVANKIEGGLEGTLIDRFFGGMYGAVTDGNYPLWGMGLGMGSNVGAKILTGDVGFAVSEGEWGRLIGEMGLILGLAMILIRGGLVMDFVAKAWRSISVDNFLPWMLLSFGIVIILQGQWAQPTSLGFSVLIGGLILASFNKE